MKVEYGKYPLSVKWFRWIDYMNSGKSKLYECEEKDCSAKPYVFSTERPGNLFTPIISLTNREGGLIVDIVAEIVLSIEDRPNPVYSTEPVDISIQQVVEQIEKIKKEDYYFVADAFEVFVRESSFSDPDCKNRQILRFYRFKDL
ncbi:MAG: hypothetical protein AAB736_00330 [Patescibacteria group bacterium]